MTTSDLYHIWGCKDYYQLPGTTYGAFGTTFKIAPKDHLLRCPVCGSPKVVRHGSVLRKLLTSQVGTNKCIHLQVDVPIVECKKCHNRRQIELKIAAPKKRYTKSFARDVLFQVREMSILSVSRLYSVSWDMIRSILKDYLEKNYPKKNFKHLRNIAIDEVAVGKGHVYLTTVYDLNIDEPIFVGDGKAEKALVPFWNMIGPRRCKKIQCVSIDMGRAYQAAVRNNLPNAQIVFDRFHVVKLANQYLDMLRRQLMGTKTYADMQVIKGARYLLLKNPDNLDKEKKEHERLERLLALNSPLTKMYILKEDLRQFWEKNSREEAEAAIDTWIADAMGSGIPLLIRLAEAIERYKEGILNYYTYRVSSGPLEGFNNKIKFFVRRAYGYRNMAFFKLVILAANEITPNKFSAFNTS